MMQERGLSSSSRCSVMAQNLWQDPGRDGEMLLERLAYRFQCEIRCTLTGWTCSAALHSMAACCKGLWWWVVHEIEG
jgi:hypothetical protein